MALICMPLMANDTEQFSSAYLPSVYLPQQNVLLFNFESSLYVLDSRPLLGMCFTNDFSQSVDCLFILFMLLQSNLF
jgi:hypothetical protein